jgi:hypothetical protein
MNAFNVMLGRGSLHPDTRYTLIDDFVHKNRKLWEDSVAPFMRIPGYRKSWDYVFLWRPSTDPTAPFAYAELLELKEFIASVEQLRDEDLLLQQLPRDLVL